MQKEATNVVCLAFAYLQLQLVAEGKSPAVAGEHVHLLDVIDIHNCIPVHALKRRRLQAGFDRTKSLGCEKTALCRDDPDKIAFRLKGDHFIGLQQEEIPSNAANQLPGEWGAWRFGNRGNLRQALSDLRGLAEQRLGPIQRLV